MFIAYCPGLGIKAIGATITDARTKLADAVSVFMETASSSEIRRRQEVYVTQIEVEDHHCAAEHSLYASAPEFLAASRHDPVKREAGLLPAFRAASS